MNLLIKQAKVVDPSSPFNGQLADIFIEKGMITKIGTSITDKADKEISVDGLCVSPGWVDVFANFADPGYEFKETLETGAAAAAAGGLAQRPGMVEPLVLSPKILKEKNWQKCMI